MNQWLCHLSDGKTEQFIPTTKRMGENMSVKKKSASVENIIQCKLTWTSIHKKKQNLHKLFCVFA